MCGFIGRYIGRSTSRDWPFGPCESSALALSRYFWQYEDLGGTKNMSSEQEDVERAIAGLKYASAIVNREIINAVHHQDIQGLNRALDAIRDEIAKLQLKLGDAG